MKPLETTASGLITTDGGGRGKHTFVVDVALGGGSDHVLPELLVLDEALGEVNAAVVADTYGVSATGRTYRWRSWSTWRWRWSR